MLRIFIAACFFMMVSCMARNAQSVQANTTDSSSLASNTMLPACLLAKVDSMSNDPSQGKPVSITRYLYRGQTVYYMKSPCCDRFNIVFDSSCNVLGYPDGGYTGRGDGKFTSFREEATAPQVVWPAVPSATDQ